ncbi:MAG: SagB/ThcOx family dehydrogenase [Pseudomonadota bacterium]
MKDKGKIALILAGAACAAVIVTMTAASSNGDKGGVETGTMKKAKKKEGAALPVGQRFHGETSLGPAGAPGDALAPKPARPPLYKTYKKAKVVKLPKAADGAMTVEQAIDKRRSVRAYTKEAMTMAELSRLLHAAQGITASADGHDLRAAPSGGALYPIEIYPVVNNVEGLDSGIYHYRVPDHALELVKAGDFSGAIEKAGLGQGMLGDADVTIVMSAVFDRSRCKYGERGLRYIYMEAGHISQNIWLQAVALGMGSAVAGAFFDDKANKLLGLDGKDEAVLYMQAVGTI